MKLNVRETLNSSALLISYKFSYVLIVLDHEIVKEVTGYTYGQLSDGDPSCLNRLKIGSRWHGGDKIFFSMT